MPSARGLPRRPTRRFWLKLDCAAIVKSGMIFRPRVLVLSFFVLFTFSLGAASYNHYAVILQDQPVQARRGATASIQAEPRRQAILNAQAAIRTQLQSSHVQVTGSAQSLLNAVFVVATPDQADSIRSLPGVKSVVKLGVRHLHLDAAAQLINAPAAWSSLGGIP
ncbi:MAG: peptidase and in, kexin, sedolisin, partial [Bryobacterales bacterium]|nr:peptidase and in, kexin, sedolisin [Bryobacterales bacterium]